MKPSFQRAQCRHCCGLLGVLRIELVVVDEGLAKGGLEGADLAGDAVRRVLPVTGSLCQVRPGSS